MSVFSSKTSMIRFVAVCILSLASTAYSAVSEFFLHTFTNAGDLTAYTPMDGNGPNIQTFLSKSVDDDGSFFDASNDGYVQLHRTAPEVDVIGMTLPLGTIAAENVGFTLHIDAAFSVPDSGMETEWELQINGSGVGGQGKMVVNTFSVGNAPGHDALLLSAVALGSINPQRTNMGPLAYTIQTSDVGKVVELRFAHYDSTNVGGEGTRNLNLDAISYWTSAASVTTNLWDQFVTAKTAGTEPILPDYSYAGYELGETGIPVAQAEVFNVTNYGAVANDGLSDRIAIEAAIQAADTNGGGIVFFPPGVFNVNETTGTASGIEIHGQNIILQGSGSGPGGTEIFMRENMNNITMISFSPPAYPLQHRTTVTADSDRETFNITVANASSLQVDMLVELTMKNPAANAEFLDGLVPWDNWTTTINDGVYVRGERHRIKSITGNVVTFYAPVHCNILAAHGWSVRSSDFIRGWGVEDIHFRGNWQDVFVHHLNETHDSGWQMLSFFYGDSPYLRRCRFTDVSMAANVSACYAGTILNCSIEGNQGHSSFASGYYSYGTLMAYCADIVTNGAFHGFGANAGSVGTVITHCKNSNRGFDWHASWPYCSLIDDCSGGLIGNGGNVAVLPNHMRYLTFWNFNQTAGPIHNQYDWWEARVGSEQYSGAKIVRPIIVGYHGLGTTFKPDTCQAIESHGTPVAQHSLYDSQLHARLGTLPAWLDEARLRYDYFIANGYWPKKSYAKLSYDEWSSGHGLTGADIELLADPDADRIPNLTEYAVYGIPSTGTNSPTEKPTIESVEEGNVRWLDYIHRRRLNASALGLTYAVEFTDDLSNSTWSTNEVSEPGSLLIDNSCESVTNRVLTNNSTNGFLRLRVEFDG